MDRVEEAFRQNERLLWGLGYRMTGLSADADELVQETFLRAMEHPVPDDGRPLRPWLVRVCANLARDRLRRRRRRQGPHVWLPAPVRDDRLADGLPADVPTDDAPDARYTRAESARLAFLLALESLTPTQRAVLLLRDVFEHDAEEVAEMLGSSPGAVRVAHHKARRALAAAGVRRVPDPAAHLAAMSAFLGALAAGDPAGALAVLAPDVVLRNDGGAYHAARMPIRGAAKVLKFLASVSADIGETRWAVHTLNGLPMVVVELLAPPPNRAPRSVMGVTLADDGRIASIHWLLDPAKLADVPHV